MKYPEAYIDYLVEFHGTRDYFECHEIMEEHWKEDAQDPLTVTWLGLIQVAVSSYHHRRGNRAGAVKMLHTAIKHSDPQPLSQLGIDATAWIQALQIRYEALVQQQEEALFTDLNIPLVDDRLIARCEQRCIEAGLTWCAPSDISNVELIHRHKLRDRSEVIAERKRQLAARHANNA